MKSPQAKTKQVTKGPCQSFEVGRAPWVAARAAPAWMWGRKPCQQGHAEWGLAWGQTLLPLLYFSALPGWASCHAPVLQRVKCSQCACLSTCTRAHHMHRELLKLCSAKVSGNLFTEWCRQDFPPWKHLLPDACACDCLCIYIHFTVQSTYRKASSLFKYFFQLEIAWRQVLTVTVSHSLMVLKSPSCCRLLQ